MVAACANLPRLKREQLRIDYDGLRGIVFQQISSFGVNEMLDNYALGSRGSARYSVDPQRAVRRTIPYFIRVEHFYNAATGIVNTRGPDQAALSPVISAKLLDVHSKTACENILLEFSYSGRRPDLRPRGEIDSIVFSHLHIPVLAQFLKVSVTVFISISFGAYTSDYDYTYGGAYGRVYLFFVECTHKYFILGYRAERVGIEMSIPLTPDDSEIPLQGHVMDLPFRDDSPQFSVYSEPGVFRKQSGMLCKNPSACGRSCTTSFPHRNNFERLFRGKTQLLRDMSSEALLMHSILIGLTDVTSADNNLKSIFMKPLFCYNVPAHGLHPEYHSLPAAHSFDSGFYQLDRVDDPGRQIRFRCVYPNCLSFLETCDQSIFLRLECNHAPCGTLLGRLPSENVADIMSSMNRFAKEIAAYHLQYSDFRGLKLLSSFYKLCLENIQLVFLVKLPNADFSSCWREVGNSPQKVSCSRIHKVHLRPVRKIFDYDFANFARYCRILHRSLSQTVVFHPDTLSELHDLCLDSKMTLVCLYGAVGVGKSFLLMLLCEVVTGNIVRFSSLVMFDAYLLRGGSRTKNKIFVVDHDYGMGSSTFIAKILGLIPPESVLVFTSNRLAVKLSITQNISEHCRFVEVRQKPMFLYHLLGECSELTRYIIPPGCVFLVSRRYSKVCYARKGLKNCWKCFALRQIEGLRDALKTIMVRKSPKILSTSDFNFSKINSQFHHSVCPVSRLNILSGFSNHT